MMHPILKLCHERRVLYEAREAENARHDPDPAIDHLLDCTAVVRGITTSTLVADLVSDIRECRANGDYKNAHNAVKIIIDLLGLGKRADQPVLLAARVDSAAELRRMLDEYAKRG
jgi:hypothetical protein